jgi:hypothetical protein
MKQVLVTTAVLVLSLAAAQAFADPAPQPPQTCAPPAGPPPESSRPIAVGAPPPLPACDQPRPRRESCRREEIDRYNSSIDAFNQRIAQHNAASRAYIDALNAWMTEVNTYVQCEVNIVNAEARRSQSP